MPDPIVNGELCPLQLSKNSAHNVTMTDIAFLAVCIDTPELAGDTIAWLTSERREWLAGRYVSCNWDMTELLVRREEIVEKDLLKLKLAL